MKLSKKITAVITAATMFAANSVGFMPNNPIKLPDLSASAADTEYSGLCGENMSWYLDVNTGQLTITGTGDMYDWDPLESPWYSWRNTIKCIIIKEGVTSIGNYAFLRLYNLSSVSLPSTLNRIGELAFRECKLLKEISFPNKLEYIGSSAFYDCNCITSIILPDSVTSLGNSVFMECDNLKDVVLSSNIDNLSSQLFSYCKSLTSISIPSSVTSIGGYAFSECSKLTSIVLSENVNDIGIGAFDSCPNLKSIRIENPDCNLSYDIPEYTLEDGRNFPGLKTIPDTTVIYGIDGSTAQAYAEMYNRNFVSLNEKPAVEIIDSGECGAQGDNVIWQLDSEGTLTISGEGAMEKWEFKSPFFDYGDDIIRIIIKSGVTTIGDNAFWNCTNLTSISMPDSVTSIGAEVFQFCTSLKSITIPDSVVSIGKGAFYNCESLTSIKLPANLTSVESGVFSFCRSLESITIPGSVTTIGVNAFCFCENLNAVIINEGVISIEDNAFYRCERLSSITMPNSVNSIGGYVFDGCSSLESITIPNGVESISEGLFGGCTSLKSIIVPDSVTSIGGDAFSGTPWLESKREENSIVIINGILIDGTTCEGDVIITHNVTTIGYSAFSGCEGLTSITIPNSVTSIRDYAFDDCSSLTSITIPDSVTSIGGDAFSGTPWLESKREENPLVIANGILIDGSKCEGDVIIPDSVTNICNSAFSCIDSGLTSIIIPDSVTSIGSAAFHGCSNLTSITIPDSVTTIGYSAFSECEGLTSITIPDGITSIEMYTFAHCSNLVSITIPDSVISIGYGAFRDCKSLTSITIPGSITSIEAVAFLECTNLTSVTIPESVTSIKSDTFQNCTSLTSIKIENPECEIYDLESTISNGQNDETFDFYFDGTIYGYEGSTAQAYAEKYNRKFAVIDGEKPVTTSTTTTSTTTSTTTTTTTTTTTKTTTTRIVTTTAVSNKPAFVNGADNWSFSNSRNNFGNSYYMKDEYWNTLMNGLSNIEKEYMNEYVRNSYWGGSCYGMAVTSILASYDILKPNNYQNNANFLNDILSPPNNDVKSIINYYFALQFTDVMQQQTNISVFTDEKDKLDYIVKCLEDDSPTLLCYFGYFHGFDWGGHAVVAYDVEYGTYSYGGKAYNGKIVTYDNNSVDYDADYCLYFNSSNGNWIIPAYELDSTNESVLGLITDDLKYINYHGYLNGTTNKSSNDYIATLRSASLKDNYNLIKANYSNGIWMNSSTSTDDIKVFSSLTDNNFENSDMMFAMKDANSGYIMKTEKINALDLSMRYENTLLNIDADACQIAKFSPNGYVEIEGEQTAYDIEIVLNDGHMVTNWYGLSVTGDNADKVNLRTVKNGYIMSATDLNNITAEAFNDNVTAEAHFSTDYNSVFIYEIDENTIGVSVDTDGDGTYETNINTQPTYTLGDVNDDETIDASDASLVLAEYAKIQTGGNQTFTENQKSAADVNTDGVVDASDASKILVYYAAISTGKEPSWK